MLINKDLNHDRSLIAQEALDKSLLGKTDLENTRVLESVGAILRLTENSLRM